VVPEEMVAQEEVAEHQAQVSRAVPQLLLVSAVQVVRVQQHMAEG
jgi:hypothetical protein